LFDGTDENRFQERDEGGGGGGGGEEGPKRTDILLGQGEGLYDLVKRRVRSSKENHAGTGGDQECSDKRVTNLLIKENPRKR